MTHDVIDRLVRPANPVPDPKMLEAVEVSTPDVQRREEMQGQQVEVGGDRAAEKPRRRGPLVGIAAAVAVLVIGGLVLIRATDESGCRHQEHACGARHCLCRCLRGLRRRQGGIDAGRGCRSVAMGGTTSHETGGLTCGTWRQPASSSMFDECVEQPGDSDAVTVSCEYVASRSWFRPDWDGAVRVSCLPDGHRGRSGGHRQKWVSTFPSSAGRCGSRSRPGSKHNWIHHPSGGLQSALLMSRALPPDRRCDRVCGSRESSSTSTM